MLRQNRDPLLLIAVLFALLVLMSAQVKTEGSNLLERTLFRTTSPVLRLTFRSLALLESSWRRYVHLGGVRQKNEVLAGRLQELLVLQQQTEEIHRENQRLRRLLGLRERLPLSVIAAKLLVNQSDGPLRTILLDQGTEAGVVKDMPVVVEEGIVGRVVRPQARASVVELITDAGAAAAVHVVRTGLQGIVAGRGGDTLRLQYIPEQEDVVPGDCLVTSGHDGIYPEGLGVGCVTRVGPGALSAGRGEGTGLMMEIEVEPAVDFSRLREVLLLVAAGLPAVEATEPE
jgi:rod shape-determining protein MreC